MARTPTSLGRGTSESTEGVAIEIVILWDVNGGEWKELLYRKWDGSMKINRNRAGINMVRFGVMGSTTLLGTATLPIIPAPHT